MANGDIKPIVVGAGPVKVNQHQVNAFNAACKHKGFSKAAAALGVTQSSVTQNVAKFEASIGAKLFERRRSGLVLTPAGNKIYAVTEEIGLLHTILEERMNEYAKLDRGLLRIVAAASRPAMTYMKRFMERYPGVDVTFDNASWRQCADMLRSRDADVALMPDPEVAAGLYVCPIEDRQHTALIHDGHPLFAHEAVSISDLAQTALILSSTRSFARWRLEQRASELGIVFSNVTKVGSTPMAIEAAHHGLGVTVSYDGAIALPDNLRSVPISELSEPYRLVAACNNDIRDLALIRGFFDCMD